MLRKATWKASSGAEGSVKGVEAEMAVRIHNEVTLHIGADLRALGERLVEK